MTKRFLIVFQDNDNKIYYLNNLGGVSEIIDNKIVNYQKQIYLILFQAIVFDMIISLGKSIFMYQIIVLITIH